jgi:hypothetical protein
MRLTIFLSGAAAQRGSWAPHSWGFYHTQRRTTVGRPPLDEWSARRRDLYLTTHNTHNRQTSVPPLGFEPTISAGERPQTHVLDRADIGTGAFQIIFGLNRNKKPTQQSSMKTNHSSASTEIPELFYRIHNTLPIVHILSQISPFHALPLDAFQIHFHIILKL